MIDCSTSGLTLWNLWIWPIRYSVSEGPVHPGDGRRRRGAHPPWPVHRAGRAGLQGWTRPGVEGDRQVDTPCPYTRSSWLQQTFPRSPTPGSDVRSPILSMWTRSLCRITKESIECLLLSLLPGGWSLRRMWRTEGSAGASPTWPRCPSTACLSCAPASQTAPCCWTWGPTPLRR